MTRQIKRRSGQRRMDDPSYCCQRGYHRSLHHQPLFLPRVTAHRHNSSELKLFCYLFLYPLSSWRTLPRGDQSFATSPPFSSSPSHLTILSLPRLFYSLGRRRRKRRKGVRRFCPTGGKEEGGKLARAEEEEERRTG